MAGVKGRSGGRNAKTRKQLALEGTMRPDRHGGFTNPSAPKGVPIPPRPLEGEALAEWQRMIARLQASKTLSIVDDAALYRYCTLHARAEQLARALAKLTSPFYETETGPRVHPGFAQLRAHDQVLRVFLVEFGLTPAARSRVRLPDAGRTGDGASTADPFSAFDEDTATAH